MKKFAFLFLVLGVLLACSQVNKTNHCKLVDVLKQETGCTTSPDGSEAHCYFGDLPPDRWGKCLEDTKREFTCIKGDTISHYKDGPLPVWKIKCEDCKILKDQIEGKGEPGERHVPIQLNIPHDKKSKA